MQADPVDFMENNIVVVNFEGAPRNTDDRPLNLVMHRSPPTGSLAKGWVKCCRSIS